MSLDQFQSAFQSFLPLPAWVEHAALAFLIICLAMVLRRSVLARMAVAAMLLASGCMLLEIVPPLDVAGLTGGTWLQSSARFVFGQRQFVEVALLSLGSAWILDEIRSLFGRPASNAAAAAVPAKPPSIYRKPT
jgi:hypothetical protein